MNLKTEVRLSADGADAEKGIGYWFAPATAPGRCRSISIQPFVDLRHLRHLRIHLLFPE